MKAGVSEREIEGWIRYHFVVYKLRINSIVALLLLSISVSLSTAGKIEFVAFDRHKSQFFFFFLVYSWQCDVIVVNEIFHSRKHCVGDAIRYFLRYNCELARQTHFFLSTRLPFQKYFCIFVCAHTAKSVMPSCIITEQSLCISITITIRARARQSTVSRTFYVRIENCAENRNGVRHSHTFSLSTSLAIEVQTSTL